VREDLARGLAREHTSQAIARRLRRSPRPSYVGDAVLGAVDGTVTTFSVVASVAGAGLGPGVALALGLANVVADGVSMAAGNALRAKADRDALAAARETEERHAALVPRGEREEVRQIFEAKGLRGPTLERVVAVITGDRRRWIDTMLREEHGLRLHLPHPARTALVTFAAFVGVGVAPLVALLLARLSAGTSAAFAASTVATALTFLAVGWVKGGVLGRRRLGSSLETLALGGTAATVAWAVGHLAGDLARF
jgi:VIT1/CCC1 family predicted Fe2+/Mn2+ transporter